jgi:hypothetical protein
VSGSSSLIGQTFGNGELRTPFPCYTCAKQGLMMNERNRDYMSLVIMFLVLVLVITLLFLDEFRIIEKGAGGFGEFVRVLSIRALRA